MANDREEPPLFLALDGVTDIRNVGALARTAECAGFHGIILPKRRSAPVSADAIKSSAGALLKLPVCKVNNLTDAILYLQASGVESIACTEKTAYDIYSLNYSAPTVIILGDEERGISNQLLKVSDYQAKIPMYGAINSLNVSVAGGIVMFEAARKRLEKASKP